MARPRMAPDKKADHRVAGYVPRSVREEIDELAEREGLTRATFVKRAVMLDVARRRAAQGLAEHVEDPAVLARVAALLENIP
jgi:hypothetical protein